jgi:glycosyltransferase involved in cell wall biosynthesis
VQFPFRVEQDWPDLGTRFRRLMERLSFARHSLGHLVATGYDAVIVNKPFDFPILWQGRRRGLRAQTLFRSGGRDFYAGDRMFRSAIQHWVSASRYNARQVEARYGRSVTVIHNGVDAQAFAPLGRDAELRRSLGAGPGDFLVVSVSRLIGWKGARVVLEALAGLGERVRYVVVGEGPEEQSLRRLASESGIDHRVRFMGRVRHAELPRLLSQCDVFVQPSIGEEAFGISVVEAMACGLPVLASNNGGLPEIVVDGETGRLLPPGSVAAWRDAIAWAAADGARLAALGAKARARAGSEFTWAANAAKLEAILLGGA